MTEAEWYERNPGRRPPFDPDATDECGCLHTHYDGVCPDHTNGSLS